ncbi:MAG TPA: biotin/lipoyl-containing protein, partial [Rubrobacter sp.]|nr:biotin/lipoyl-containing protein [Rubrobacter sp.]
MAAEIHVPELGESVADATVGRWLKQEGEAVKSGDPLVELETDKINFEVEAEQDGVLESISKDEGETVNVGEVIGTIGEGGEAGDGAAPEPQAEEEQEEQPQAEVEQPEPEETGGEEQDGHREVEDGAGRASPSVRKLAQEYEVDLAEVTGSGSGGR